MQHFKTMAHADIFELREAAVMTNQKRKHFQQRHNKHIKRYRRLLREYNQKKQPSLRYCYLVVNKILPLKEKLHNHGKRKIKVNYYVTDYYWWKNYYEKIFSDLYNVTNWNDVEFWANNYKIAIANERKQKLLAQLKTVALDKLSVEQIESALEHVKGMV